MYNLATFEPLYTTLALHSEIWTHDPDRLERGLRLRNALRHRVREWRSRTDEEDIVMCARIIGRAGASPPSRTTGCTTRVGQHRSHTFGKSTFPWQ